MNYSKLIEEAGNIDETTEKKIALATLLELEPEEGQNLEDFLAQILNTTYSPDTFEAEGGDYLVLTNEEADEKWEESLDNYIDECITPELPEHLRFYFDDEKWKQDARHDGRGHSLATYDGNEEEITVNGTDYYIYRIN